MKGAREQGVLEEAGTIYLSYLNEVHTCLAGQEKAIRGLISLIEESGAVHVFGFGRSGASALSLAIRLRHFCGYLPPAWWIGDQVRMPIRQADLLILFSKSGSRPEVMTAAGKAADVGARVAVITANRMFNPGGAAVCTIHIPLCESPFIYGGGDFELASYFFQEILVSMIGAEKGIPKDEVEKNHV
ncbi:MAG: SIS domain-containing protein [Methanolinea sp.]|nr:SIS domain-containing protein [Methanolinea sp.]